MKSPAVSLTSVLVEGPAWLLAALFTYTAVSKVYDWRETKFALYNQWFPEWLTEALLYGLPIVEVLVAISLLIPALRKFGFMASSLLMLSFTGYVSWVWFGFTGRTPCSCGGVLGSLGWGEHLVFNLVFLTVAVIGYWSNERVKTEMKNLKNLSAVAD
ncbi:Methylamine utilisation protein MauE [Algoriphagus locisalis]|uniref:Methylamine utilisation protein MauE n=1 Tax=Algoriphagus locisalis TaxID=305507 RepID=A0A1I7CR58_9BACT|nr:MauE/DoxX family redox-associated membrane protein [Algoriphagus locisalis]SFU01874.1 Methylamine utilisation protein MauE [Algoriphagus locisalis]